MDWKEEREKIRRDWMLYMMLPESAAKAEFSPKGVELLRRIRAAYRKAGELRMARIQAELDANPPQIPPGMTFYAGRPHWEDV
jgi:hypothetical protein